MPCRAAAQTETAQFWFQGSLVGWTGPLRVALGQAGGPPVRRAALVAAFHVVLVDTQIATSDSKYTHVRWRPVTALRHAEAHADPQWTPRHETPAHPDFPSGHNTYAGAAEVVLGAFVGPAASEPFVVTSPTAPGVNRTYQRWSELTTDNVDARVWSGHPHPRRGRGRRGPRSTRRPLRSYPFLDAGGMTTTSLTLVDTKYRRISLSIYKKCESSRSGRGVGATAVP